MGTTPTRTRNGDLPANPYKSEGDGFIQPPDNALEAGTSELVIAKGPVKLSPWDIENVTQGRVYVLGTISYEGRVVGVTYVTAFCREWSSERERFVPTKNDDYEYQD